MINKKENRLRRAGATRARIKLQKVNRLTVHRTNLHIYASIISASGEQVGEEACLSCGEKMTSNAAFCQNCGRPIPPGAKFCPECGAPAQR